MYRDGIHDPSLACSCDRFICAVLPVKTDLWLPAGFFSSLLVLENYYGTVLYWYTWAAASRDYVPEVSVMETTSTI